MCIRDSQLSYVRKPSGVEIPLQGGACGRNGAVRICTRRCAGLTENSALLGLRRACNRFAWAAAYSPQQTAGAPPCRWLRRPRRRRLPRAVVLSSGGCLVRVGNRVGNRVGARRDWLRRGRAQGRQAQREVIDRQRAAEEVSLPEVDAGVAGLGCLTQVLDALGHRCEPERLRQADDGVHDRAPSGLAEVADEVPIDLEDVHRYAGELGQAGVAGAKVVERDLYAGLAQVLHRPVGPQDRELALGDLQGQSRWRKSVAGQHAGHRHREVVGELGGRDVDEQLRQVAALLLPARHLRDRLLENPPADLADGAAVLGELAGAEALLRWTHPLLGVVPPDEFIPLAEDSGAISQIGRWVLEQSVAQMARWQQQGRYLPQLFGNAVAAGPLPAAAVRQRRGRPVHRRPPAQTDPL